MAVTLDNDVEQILKGRKPAFGRFCKTAGGLTLATQAQPYVDESAMSARATINTPREDREGDIILPMGVQLDNYRANPVVLWEHGLGSIDRPIAKCVTPEGDLALTITEDEITAVSYFSEKCIESLQVFHLIAEGLVRATSVRAEPIKSFAHKTKDGVMGLTLEVWDLVEWSWGCMGVNPDAVAKILDRGTIEGDKIAPCILKSLTAVAPKPADFFKGITLPKVKTMAEDTTKPEDETKMDAPEDQNPDEKKMDTPVEDEEPVADLERMDDMEEEDVNLAPGEQALASLHNTYRTLKSEIDAAATMVEQPEVRELVAGLADGVETVLEQIESLDAKTYKGALGKMDTADEEADKLEAVKRLKSWRGHTGNQYRLGYIRDKIRTFSAYNNLTSKQRKELSGIAKSVRRIETEVVAYKPDVSDQQVEELADQLAALTKTVRDMAHA